MRARRVNDTGYRTCWTDLQPKKESSHLGLRPPAQRTGGRIARVLGRVHLGFAAEDQIIEVGRSPVSVDVDGRLDVVVAYERVAVQCGQRR